MVGEQGLPAKSPWGRGLSQRPKSLGRGASTPDSQRPSSGCALPGAVRRRSPPRLGPKSSPGVRGARWGSRGARPEAKAALRPRLAGGWRHAPGAGGGGSPGPGAGGDRAWERGAGGDLGWERDWDLRWRGARVLGRWGRGSSAGSGAVGDPAQELGGRRRAGSRSGGWGGTGPAGKRGWGVG